MKVVFTLFALKKNMFWKKTFFGGTLPLSEDMAYCFLFLGRRGQVPVGQANLCSFWDSERSGRVSVTSGLTL